MKTSHVCTFFGTPSIAGKLNHLPKETNPVIGKARIPIQACPPPNLNCEVPCQTSCLLCIYLPKELCPQGGYNLK